MLERFERRQVEEFEERFLDGNDRARSQASGRYDVATESVILPQFKTVCDKGETLAPWGR